MNRLPETDPIPKSEIFRITLVCLSHENNDQYVQDRTLARGMRFTLTGQPP